MYTNQYQTYNGNQYLKRKGQTHDYTAEEIAELVLCSTDIVAFAKHFKIQTIDYGLQTFGDVIYDYQIEHLRLMYDNRYVAINYPRQSSKTTLASVLILHDVIFQEYRNFFIVSNKEDSSKDVLDRIKLAFEHLPEFLKLGVVEWNKKSIEFENGSKIYAATTTSSSIRGKTGSLYCDETAFIENFDEFWKSTYPVMTTGKTARSILTSTPNKMNHWYKIWMNSMRGVSNYFPLTIKWDTPPDRDEAWKQKVIGDVGEEAWLQEYECSFMGSSNTLIPSKTLLELVAIDPVFINDKRNYRIYKQPVKTHEYVACVDTARGKGIDYSAISVIDVTDYPFEQVAVFKDNEINAVLFPEYILSVCKQYNNAWVLVETNDNGEEVVNRLNYDYEYDYILSPKIDKTKYALGMRTTTKTKRIGCNNVRDLLVNHKLLIHDEDTIFEFANFIIKGNSYEAEKEFHDDIVMTLVIFAWLVTLPEFEDIRKFNFKRKVYEKSEKQIFEELIPFGFIDDGLDNIDEPEIIIENGEIWTLANVA